MREFPVPEDKSALNPEAQFAWLWGEVSYSMDKDGYDKKIARLKRDPSDPGSVFAIRESYWSRFQGENNKVQEFGQPAVPRALNMLGKTLAGVCDKLAMTYWLEQISQGEQNDQIDKDELINYALRLTSRTLPEIDAVPGPQALALIDLPISSNMMGTSMLLLHEEFRRSPGDLAALGATTLAGSAGGLRFFQSYAGLLAAQYDVTLPRPGVPGGDILPWE